MVKKEQLSYTCYRVKRDSDEDAEIHYKK